MPNYVHLEPAPVSQLASEARVRTRDGVHLATDVYVPDGDAAPGDTVLIRLPYDKSGEYTFIPMIAEYFMAHGYRVVAQDVRGKFRSEGEPRLFVNEVNDGYDTLEWITQQSWSNGKVAMWGDSYYGYTQWAAAASEHPALKAIAPRLTGTQLGEPVHRSSSDRTRRVETAITNTYSLTHFFENDTYLWELDWSQRNFAEQAEEFMVQRGKRSAAYDQWVPNVVTQPRFPKGSAFAGHSVPTLHTIGWWDNCGPLSWNDVAEISRHPNWDAHHYLLVESIDHESYQLIEAEGERVEHRSEDQIRSILPRTLDRAIEFFEVFLRGNGKPNDLPRVRWNLAGTDEVRIGNVWPPTESRVETLSASANGVLGLNSPADPHTVEWTHNPLDLVPSSVPDAFSYLLHFPDEAPIGDRDDVLVFTTEPMDADVELAGDVAARVHVQSSGPVMDIFVRVLDLAPDGTALRISRGQQQLLSATDAARLTIPLDPVGYLLRAGHRIRVHVSSSDYPEFLPQPGTGADPWTGGERTVLNRQRLTVGGPDGFSIDLPVLKGTLQ